MFFRLFLRKITHLRGTDNPASLDMHRVKPSAALVYSVKAWAVNP